jgi:sugar phosphate isomerase/epimerase
MRLSLTTWSLPSCTLPEAVGIARALGIGALDLGYFYRSALDRAAVLREPERVAGTVRALGLPVANFYHLFGASVAERNLADPTHHEANERDFRAVAKFCKAAGIPTIFVLPGICNPGQGRGEAIVEAAKGLRRLVAVAHHDGLDLTVEPHVHSFLESPALTLELLERVPGLHLTLDYAHFVCLGWRQDEIDVLASSARHIHLRQARPGALQAKFAKGTINFPALLARLRDAEYDGSLALEAVHQDYFDTIHDDVLTEIVAMRDAVRAWIGSPVRSSPAG